MDWSCESKAHLKIRYCINTSIQGPTDKFTKVQMQFKLEKMTRPYPRWAMPRGNSDIIFSNYRESFEIHRHDGTSNLNLSVGWGKQSSTKVSKWTMLSLSELFFSALCPIRNYKKMKGLSISNNWRYLKCVIK